jgi:hypothetical protein
LTTWTSLTELLASGIDLDTDLTAVIDASASGAAKNKKVYLASLFSAFLSPIAPGGRLTLTSNTPVMIADAAAQSSVYYAPFSHARIPIWTGVMWIMRPFAQLTMALDTSNQTSTNIYDLFVWNNGGTIAIGAGPAWSSSTARGTGAGTTELELKDGIWTNKVSITLKNGAGAGTTGVAANTATYVGSVYCTANGQTAFMPSTAGASGGSAVIMGIWNAYNRVLFVPKSRDTTASWTYGTVTWRPQNNSTSNRITWLDGLAQSGVSADYAQVFSTATSGAVLYGITFDSTTAAPEYTSQVNSVAAGAVLGSVTNTATSPGMLGLHYCQAMECAATAVTQTAYGAVAGPTRQCNELRAVLMM